MLKRTVVPALAAAALGALLPVPAAADPASEAAVQGTDVAAIVDPYIADALAAENIPGAAVSFVANGETVYSEGFGVADLDSRTPVDPERTGFLIGSQAKLFTAQAALQLVAAGELDLDADVNTYLDDFQIEDAFPGHPVTLRHLLTHTAGFDDDFLVGSGGTDPADIPDFGERIAEVQPERVRTPGVSVTYSNYGVALAGYLVETVSGVPYEEYVAANVLAPLGMDGTTVALPYPEPITAGLATGYALDSGRNEPADLAWADFPAAGAGPVATSADMARYMIASLAHDSRIGPGVAEQMLQRQHTEDDALPGMGFQWEQLVIGGHDAWFKGGDFPGFHSTMFLLPEHGIGLHVIANGDGYSGSGIDGNALLDRLIEALLPAMAAPAAEPVPDAESDTYEGWYHSSRTSENSLYKLKSLFETPIRVRAVEDGGIVTDGIWEDGIEWVQVAPGRFQRPGTWDQLVFDPDGTIAVSGATEVLEPTRPLDHPYLHLALLGFAVVTALAGLFALPIAALIARRRGAERTRTARAAAWIGWTACASITTAVVLLIALAAVPATFQVAVATASAPLAVMLTATSLSVPFAVVMTAATAMAWTRRRWRGPGRIGYTVLTLATVAFACVATVYNMTGPSFT
ncbi:serine hydrolase [Glycomyces sp. NPDC048151]|uniref:serine hydrolase n=1 Tax=Glycomyces sp. NPDC048151 TaxID=3364002 RepID=UPI003717CD6B